MKPFIRDFEETDYDQAVELAMLVYPEYPETADEWRHDEDHRRNLGVYQRLVSTAPDGQMIGYATIEQPEGMFHPRKFHLWMLVHPQARRQGVGGAMLERMMAIAEPTDPIAYLASAREDHADALRFVERRGYREVMRTWENHLDMANYDPEPFRTTAARAIASDITIHSLQELAADPDRFRKLYNLVEAVSVDIPSPVPRTPRAFDDQWISRVMDNPGLLPNAYMIAVDQSLPERPYVALSNMWRNQATDDVDTGLTGVRREYRRRGLAIALKLACLDRAREMGAPRVRTWNASDNMPMLAINEQLGFEKRPAWIEYLHEPVDAARQ